MSNNPTLSVKDNVLGVTVSVTYDRYDGTHFVMRYTITDTGAGDVLLYERDDLRVPGKEVVACELKAMRSLGSFLGAYAEAVAYEYRTGSKSENSDLFPGLDGDVAEALFQTIREVVGEDE